MISYPQLRLSPAESSRLTIQALRWDLLNQNFGDDASGEANIRPAIDGYLGPVRAALIPRVDFSNNSLLTVATQLTTPGLYQRAPEVGCTDPDGERIHQALTAAKYWVLMQRTQFLAAGMGDALLHMELRDGALSVREVPPQACFPEFSPEDPSRVTVFRELRLRDLSAIKLGVRWCLDVYDVANAHFWIETIEAGHLRVTNILPGVDADGLSGDAYPWKINGKPVFPYVHYSTEMSGNYWHHNSLRGITRATIRGMAFETMANQSAMDSSHSTAIALNVELPASAAGGIGQDPPATSMAILPGSLLSLDVKDAATPASITQLRPAADLAQLRLWAQGEEARLLSRLGLSADDIRGVGDNPMSADALMIKRAAKQAVSDRMEPLFRDADMYALALAGAILNGPTSGYSISYFRAPQTAEERKAEAEADAAELALGMVSRVQLYQRRHPGASTTDAIRSLRLIQAQEQLFEPDEPAKPAETTETTPTEEES